MKRSELLDRLSSSPEERLLLSQAADRLELCQRKCIPTHTNFLSPAGAAAVQRLIDQSGDVRCLWWGGYPKAERQLCVFLPDWLEPEDFSSLEPCPISALRAVWYRDERRIPTHRDLLGSLMGLGIARDRVGDILVGEGQCDILLLSEIAAFVLQNLEAAGRVRLKLSPLSLGEITSPSAAVKTIWGTVSSLRLDAILAAAFSLSRSKAAAQIAAGHVAVDWQETERPDLLLPEGSVISCRGLGKCRLAQVGGLTRKGRLSVVLERYI